jgi:aspartate carbamoyltransferase catalytic subunit
MVPHVTSLLDFDQISADSIESLFSLAEKIKQKKLAPRNKGEVLGLMFFEASTRTRLSFETAAARAGVGCFYFDSGAKSSLEKGETVEDAIFNVAAMSPDVLVIRASAELPLKDIAKKIKVPVINAGWGILSHPTQALLDMLTLRSRWKSLNHKKILIVGDLKHSRVAGSHFQLAQILGYQIGQCGPAHFLSNHPSIQTFHNLGEGLKWADAVMALRNQFERHEANTNFSKETFRAQFGLNGENLKNLSNNGFILHPGPINHGIELETDVLLDKRCLVLDQVQHGVYLREALLRSLLGEA